MEIFNPNSKIDFMRHAKIAMTLSMAAVVIAIALVFTKGLNFGLDFTGGTVIELRFTTPPDIEEVRDTLEKAGFADAVVKTVGTSSDISVELELREGLKQEELSNQVFDAVRGKYTAEGVEKRRVDFVGPQVGRELVEQGSLAVIYTLIGILIYVILRFEWKFAVGAILATIHDIAMVVGLFAIFGWTFDLAVLAALLAVIGYSLNDTIVVFDRVRENFRGLRKATPYEAMNKSVNETLSRTIMTSLTTLITVVALFLFGGEALRGFSLALIVGIVVGTYSSIYVASAFALFLGVTKQDLMPVEKEQFVDGRP
jgi:preprotein translocase subunit SecF